MRGGPWATRVRGSVLGVELANATTIEPPTRRDFLFLATGAAGAVGVAAVAWPLVDQMNPDASTLAMSSIEVDIGAIPEGQIVTVKWRGGPVFIRHRTKKEIEEARKRPAQRAARSADRRLSRQEAGMADCRGRLHASRLRAARARRQVRGLVLPLPRFDVRYVGAHPSGARAAQSRRAGIHVPQRHEGEDRLTLEQTDVFVGAPSVQRFSEVHVMSGPSTYVPKSAIGRWFESRLPLMGLCIPRSSPIRCRAT